MLKTFQSIYKYIYKMCLRLLNIFMRPLILLNLISIFLSPFRIWLSQSNAISNFDCFYLFIYPANTILANLYLLAYLAWNKFIKIKSFSLTCNLDIHDVHFRFRTKPCFLWRSTFCHAVKELFSQKCKWIEKLLNREELSKAIYVL